MKVLLSIQIYKFIMLLYQFVKNLNIDYFLVKIWESS